MPEPLLRVRGLQAWYDESHILHGVDFEVLPGEVVTLLGRNGMGRSTTIKCLFGLLPARGGSIEYRGRRLDGLAPHRIAREGLGLVPEGRQVFPNLSVEENLIATARGAEGWDLERVYGFFPRLRERRRNLGSQLSGGEQQMLAIGRALMTNPSLLVLDEATEGLAPVVREEIWKALGELRAQGLSMIVVDKNINALMGLADRHYVLDKGRVVWSGSSEELRADPAVVRRHLSV
jgi:branched-chain amino acid transport system ATP-binding protein